LIPHLDAFLFGLPCELDELAFEFDFWIVVFLHLGLLLNEAFFVLEHPLQTVYLVLFPLLDCVYVERLACSQRRCSNTFVCWHAVMRVGQFVALRSYRSRHFYRAEITFLVRMRNFLMGVSACIIARFRASHRFEMISLLNEQVSVRISALHVALRVSFDGCEWCLISPWTRL